MDAKVEHRIDADLGGAPEGLDALIVAERIKAGGGVGLFCSSHATFRGRAASFKRVSSSRKVLKSWIIRRGTVCPMTD